MPRDTIADLAPRIRQRELRCDELVGRCLARIDAWEPRVAAWVSVDRAGARQRAVELDAELAAGRWRGPLHGIPLAIKDIIDVAGWPTLAGSPLRAGHVADRDAPLVAQLRAAGAIFLGKTVTTQFASFDPPATKNPWNLGHTPGGSSSGSAAAVATGMCVAALGSQTGGSIIRPASYCGVAGLKPSYGALDATGFVPLAWHMDHPGPMARGVQDLAILFDAVRGGPARSIEEPRGDSVCPRLAVTDGWFDDRSSDDVRVAMATAIARLRECGARIEIVPPPDDMDSVVARHRVVMAVEAAMHHRGWFPARRDQYGPCIARLMDEGRAASAVEYAAAVEGQTEFRQRTLARLADFDALVTPSVSSAAPTVETTGDPSFQSPWSYAGLPAVTLPCDINAARLPIGLQLVGAFGGEQALLCVAAWCERQLGFDDQPR